VLPKRIEVWRCAFVMVLALFGSTRAAAQGACPTDNALDHVYRGNAQVLSTDDGVTESSHGVLIRVESDRAYVVTTRHGLSPSLQGSVVVRFHRADGAAFGEAFNATVVATDNENDLALLELPPPSTRSAMPIAASDSDDLCFVGMRRGQLTQSTTPLERGQAQSTALKDRLPWDVRRKPLVQSIPWFEMTVLILVGELDAGTSGGPIVDSAGHLVGLVEGGLGGEIGWGIPRSTLVAFVEGYDPDAAQREPFSARAADAATQNLYSFEAVLEIGKALGRPRRLIPSIVGALVAESPVKKGFLGGQLDFLFDVGPELDLKNHAAMLSFRVLGGAYSDGGRRFIAPNGATLTQDPNVWRAMFGGGVGVGGHFRKRAKTSVDLHAAADGGLVYWGTQLGWFAPTLGLRLSHYKDNTSRGGVAYELFGGGINMPNGRVVLDGFGGSTLERSWQPWVGFRIGGSIGY
jgi:S1-C subfamily serine protease